MESIIKKLGKVSITVEKDYHNPKKEYNKLTVVEKECTNKTYLSRKPVPINAKLTDREYWIPFSGGTITNLADYEDITSVDDGTGINVLKFKDRSYDESNFSGKGYKILRKNIIDGKNVLTQEMINEENTVYEIRYNFDLDINLLIPNRCCLHFNGGCIKSNSNSTITFNNTILINPNLINVNTKGNIKNHYINCDFGNHLLDNVFSNNLEEYDQVLDLHGGTISDFSAINISRKSSIKIKNGTINLLNSHRFENNYINFELENIKVIFSGENNKHGFLGVTKGDISSNLILRNCEFINKNNLYIRNIFTNKFNNIIVSHCKFIDCGMQISTIDKYDELNIWNYGGKIISFDHCIFDWDANKNSIDSYGNFDAIACTTFDNIFVNFCTFNNITGSILDCYLSSNINFTGNKIINCSKGIELKSLYRESDWTNGKGNGEVPRSHSILVSNNIIINSTNFISTNINITPTVEGDLSYYISKQDKYKRNLIFSNNLIYYTEIPIDSSPKYCILGDPIMNALISNNVFYSEYDKYYFIRDRYNNDLSPLQYYYPNKIIENCIFDAPELSNLFQFYYSKNIIKNCYFENISTVNIYGNEYFENEIEISECNNLKLYLYFSKNKSNIKIKDSNNIQIIYSNQDVKIECANTYSINVKYSGLQQKVNLTAIFNNSKGIIAYNSTNVNYCIIVDEQSDIRYDERDNFKFNFKTIKPFENNEERIEKGLDGREYIYYKLINSVYVKYTFNYGNDGWFSDAGIKDTVIFSGTFSDKPNNLDLIPIGFAYFCTDKQTEEGTTNGIMIYYKGGNVWVDALGRVVS